MVGLVAGVGLLASTALQTVPFEDRPWLVYLFHVGYDTLAFAGAGVVFVLL